MYITPTYVKHFLFCPAIIVAKRLGVAEPPAEYIKDKRPLPPDAATGFIKIEREVPLRRRPLQGVVDYLAVDKWGLLVPIETKAGAGLPTASEVYQLAAYMWMAEERGVVKYGLLVKDRVYKIAYTPALEEALMAIVRQIVNIYSGGDPPYVTKRCNSCGYQKHCIYKTSTLKK